MNIETSNRFFVIITGESEEQKQALDVLSKGNRNQRKLAEIAQIIRDVFSGKKEPAALEQAIEGFMTFPVNSYWSGLIEKTGQALIQKGRSLKGKRRTDILRYGLAMFTLALSGGIPLSDQTLQVVKKLDGEADLKSVTRDLLRLNGFFKPDKATLKSARAAMTGQAGNKKRPAKSR